MKRYAVGIDIGTSGTKTVLFDGGGVPLKSATFNYPMAQPRNGWAEQNPADWWEAVKNGLSAVTAGIDAAEIAGVGLSGQMHGLVMLDRDNEVLRPSIIWCDVRTAAECREIEQLVGHDRLIARTANPALPGFTASKILWVRKNEPQIYEKCAHILLPKDYIRLRLTGEYATEVSDASGMQLLDVPGRCWSDEVLTKLSIDRALLGQVYESPDVSGTVTARASAETGLAAGTPVVGGAGDNAAAAVGMGCVQSGRAFTTIGTSGVVYQHSDTVQIDKQGRVHTFCCAVPGAWHCMGVTQGAGLSLHWFVNEFCRAEIDEAKAAGISPYVLTDRLASMSPLGANKLLFLPYLMGERTPHLDPAARGVFLGISAIHEKRDFLRAVMEGVTFSLCDCLSVFGEMGITPAEMYACGGGGTSPLWRSMLADAFGCPVSTASSAEGPALGAAILAMVGTGMYASVPAACDAIIRKDKTAEPNPKNTAAYSALLALYRSAYQNLKATFASLDALSLS